MNKRHHRSLNYDKRKAENVPLVEKLSSKKKKGSLQPQRKAAIKAHCAGPHSPKTPPAAAQSKQSCLQDDHKAQLLRTHQERELKTGSRKTAPNWKVLLWGIVLYKCYHPFFMHLKKQFRCTAKLQGEWSLNRGFCQKLGLIRRMPALSDLIRLKQPQLI